MKKWKCVEHKETKLRCKKGFFKGFKHWNGRIEADIVKFSKNDECALNTSGIGDKIEMQQSLLHRFKHGNERIEDIIVKFSKRWNEYSLDTKKLWKCVEHKLE